MIQTPIKKFIFLSPHNVRVFDISFLKKISHIVKLGIYIDLQFLLSDMSSKIVNFVTWSKVWVDLSTSLLIWGNSLFLSSVRLLSWCIVKYSSSPTGFPWLVWWGPLHIRRKKKKKKGSKILPNYHMMKFRKICSKVQSPKMIISRYHVLIQTYLLNVI